MTIATPDVARVNGSSGSSLFDVLFEALYETTGDAQRQAHDDRLRQLAELSTSDDGLDWDTLARLNIDGWGADEDSA